MKKVCFLIFILFFISFVSAESFKLKQGSYVNYRFRCVDRDVSSYCNTTTQLLFSIEDPQGQNVLNNISGTNNPTFINLSLPTDKIGTYKLFGFSPSAQNTTIELTYKVTFTGDDDTAFPIQFTILLIGFAGIGVSYFNNRLRMMRIGGSIILMTIGVLTIYPGYAGISHENILGLLIGTVTIGVGAYYVVEDFFTREEQEYFEWMDNQK